jgi:hypothetical protein
MNVGSLPLAQGGGVAAALLKQVFACCLRDTKNQYMPEQSFNSGIAKSKSSKKFLEV